MSEGLFPIYLETDKTVFINKGKDSVYRGKILLKNLTSKPIVYKVYMNKLNTYTLNNPIGFIFPLSSYEVTFRRNVAEMDQKEINDEKFMIKAFPSKIVISSKEDCKRQITSEELKAHSTQQIILGVKLEEDFAVNSLHNIKVNPGNNSSVKESFVMNNSLYNSFSEEKKRTSSIKSDDSRMLEYNLRLIDWKKRVDEIKVQIKEMEYQNEKLFHQLGNLNIIQSRRNIISFRKTKLSNSKNENYHLFFLVLVFTCGLIVGALINRIIA